MDEFDERRWRRRRRAALVLIVCATAAIVWYLGRDRHDAAPEREVSAPPPAVSTQPRPASEPAHVEATSGTSSSTEPPAAPKPDPKFFGSWKDDFYGERTMTFREDGTGTMHVQLDSVSKLLYGPEVTFSFRWTYDGDVLHLEMVDGEPKATADALSKLFGRTSDRRIEHLTEYELHMRSLDSQKLYKHRRAAE